MGRNASTGIQIKPGKNTEKARIPGFFRIVIVENMRLTFLKSNKERIISLSIGSLLFLLLLLALFRFTTPQHTGVEQPVFWVTPDTANQTPEQVSLLLQQKAKPVRNGVFNPGFTSYRWWLALELDVQEPLWVQVANPHINDIRIYQQGEQGWVETYRSGDYYPFKQRALNEADYWYPVKGHGKQTLLIRVDKKGESLNVPLRVVKQNHLATYLSDEKMIYGVFFGWILFLALMNSFLWLSLRDPIHLFYILYLLSSSLWVLSQWGLSFRYLWPESVDFTSKSRPFLSNLSYLFLLEITARFFTMPHSKPVFTKTIRVVQLLLLVSSVGLLLTRFSSSSALLRYGFLGTMNIIWLLALIIILLSIWKSYRQQPTLALFFFGALGFLSFFIVLILIAQYNVSGNWVFFVTKYGSPIGMLGESTILSFGLTQRYSQYKRDKEQAMQALEQARRETADKVIQSQEEERNRLARELHDGLGGLLGGIRMGAHHRLREQPEQQQWIAGQLDQAITDLRNIAHDLMPVLLEEQGLDKALRKTIDRWNNGETLTIHYNSDVQNRYPLSMEAGLYRIVLELLHNIKKHAEATEVQVEFWEEGPGKRITLLVEDNGRGFDATGTEGLGWKNIRYRVAYMGGKATIDSNIHGTTVIIDIPLNNERTEEA